jgi:hypothetical protein
VTGHTPLMLLSDFAGHTPALLLSDFTGHTPPPLVARAKGQSELMISLVLPCRKWDKKIEAVDLEHQIYHMTVQQRFYMYVCISRVQVLVQKQIV